MSSSSSDSSRDASIRTAESSPRACSTIGSTLTDTSRNIDYPDDRTTREATMNDEVQDREAGATAVEYALIVALIAMAVVTGVTALGLITAANFALSF